MKVIMSGPKRMPSRDDPRDPWPHMHVELEMETLPDVGEHIIWNDGSSFTVKRRMFWVDSPEDGAYWDWNADYEGEGHAKVAYLDVLPSYYDEPFTYDKALTEGIERGHEQAAAEVERLLDLASSPDVDPASALAMLRAWCKDGADKAREREAERERHAALATRILDELQAEREEKGN